MAARAGYQCLSPSHRHRDTTPPRIGKRSFRSCGESDFISPRDHEKFSLLCHASRDDFHFRHRTPRIRPHARAGVASAPGKRNSRINPRVVDWTMFLPPRPTGGIREIIGHHSGTRDRALPRRRSLRPRFVPKRMLECSCVVVICPRYSNRSRGDHGDGHARPSCPLSSSSLRPPAGPVSCGARRKCRQMS